MRCLLLVFFMVNAAQAGFISDSNLSGEALSLEVPATKEIVLANLRPQPFNTNWYDVKPYQFMEISVESTDFIRQYGMHYTDEPLVATDHTGFTEQLRVDCSGNSCPATIIPILGDYYRLSTGFAGGNITAIALLSEPVPEPSSFALLLLALPIIWWMRR